MLRIEILLLCFSCAASSPLINGQEFGGDKAEYPYMDSYGLDRNSILENQRWPQGRIPYVITDSLRYYEKQIREVMDYIEGHTCITFPKKTDDDKTYINIINGPGCFAYIGTSSMYTNMTVSLNSSQCMVFGVILHELTHSIGFFHEHARLDRDEFVEIHWENIPQALHSEFKKVDPKKTTTFNKFDYDSIMMYDDLIFSLNAFQGLKTMTPKKPGVVLKSVHLKKYTDSDIYRIKKMYNCS